MPTSSTLAVSADQRLGLQRYNNKNGCDEENLGSHRIVLEPILDQDRNLEIIDPQLQYREPLQISEGQPLILGRNMSTKIHDTRISRRLASVTVEYIDPDESYAGTQKKPLVKLLFHQCGALHRFCINGIKLLEEECVLNDGDIIGLYGNRYKYKLKIYAVNTIKVENDTQDLERESQESIQQYHDATQEDQVLGDTKRPAKRRRAGSDSFSNKDYSTDCNCEQSDSDNIVETDVTGESKHLEVISSARRNIIDEVTCTICMEIVVKAHSVNPCGHIFCKGCIQKIQPQVTIGGNYMTKSCPNCRKSMKSLSHLKSMDNLIWNMILRGDIFEEEDDVKEFMRRSGKKWGDLNQVEIECIFGRREVKMESLIEADKDLERSRKNGESLGDKDVIDLNVSQGTRNVPQNATVSHIRLAFPLARHLSSRRFIFSRPNPPMSNGSGNVTVQYEGSGSREDPIVL